MKEKTIFITGGTGFLGSYALSRNLLKGKKIHALVRNKGVQSPSERLFETIANIDAACLNHSREQLTVYNGDITLSNLGLSEESIAGLKNRIDEIWHCSALVSFDSELKDKLFGINFTGTKNIIDFARKINCRKINYVSTSYVCGKAPGMVDESSLSMDQGFNNYYEESKYNAEMFLHQLRRSGEFIVTIFRPSIIVDFNFKRKMDAYIGYYGFLKAFKILRRMAMKSAEKSSRLSIADEISIDAGKVNIPITVSGSSNGRLNFVSTEFVIDSIMAVTDDESCLNRNYHLTNPADVNTNSVFQMTATQMGISDISVGTEKKNTKIEAFFNTSVKNYVPYLHFEGIFNRQNTDEIVKRKNLRDCPAFDEEIIQTVCSNFREEN